MTTSKLSCSNPLTAVSLCVITDFGKSAPPRILKNIRFEEYECKISWRDKYIDKLQRESPLWQNTLAKSIFGRTVVLWQCGSSMATRSLAILYHPVLNFRKNIFQLFLVAIATILLNVAIMILIWLEICWIFEKS